jgi:hypothetical protein
MPVCAWRIKKRHAIHKAATWRDSHLFDRSRMRLRRTSRSEYQIFKKDRTDRIWAQSLVVVIGASVVETKQNTSHPFTVCFPHDRAVYSNRWGLRASKWINLSKFYVHIDLSRGRSMMTEDAMTLVSTRPNLAEVPRRNTSLIYCRLVLNSAGWYREDETLKVSQIESQVLWRCAHKTTDSSSKQQWWMRFLDLCVPLMMLSSDWSSQSTWNVHLQTQSHLTMLLGLLLTKGISS